MFPIFVLAMAFNALVLGFSLGVGVVCWYMWTSEQRRTYCVVVVLATLASIVYWAHLALIGVLFGL